MNLSAPFIARPVATTLLTLGIALAGIFAFLKLPISPLPQVDFPTISINATLPGASPDTVATSVASPLERHLGQIADVTEMTSISAVGSARITLQFSLDRNIDGAARDVEAAINAARADLPTSLRSNPTYRKVNPADSPVMILSLTSKTLTRGQLYDAASTVMQQRLSQLPGVGQVIIGGAALPAVRVELNPGPLFQYGIGLEDVRAALASANANSPKGAVEDGDQHYQIYTNDQASHAADYLPLVVAYRNGAAVRLSDVADVQDSVEDLRNQGLSNGQPAVLVILLPEPGANIINTVDGVRAALPPILAAMPHDIDITIASDRTTTIRSSLQDTERTLIIAVLLVTAVVFVFLGNLRATLIPAVAVPISILGTFGGDVPAGLQPGQPLADGADDRHRLRGGRRDRGAGEYRALHRAGRAAGRGGAARRARGGVHRRLDQHLADRRVHPDPADGRHRRPPVPRIRRHAIRRHPGLDDDLADHHADAVRAVSAPACEARGSAAEEPVRARDRRVWAQPDLVPAPRAAGHPGAVPDDRAERLSAGDHSQGLLPAGGHGPADRRHPGRPEHLVPVDGEEARAADGHRAEGQGGPGRRRLHRRRGAAVAARRPIPARSSWR